MRFAPTGVMQQQAERLVGGYKGSLIPRSFGCGREHGQRHR
jgi:hypothetical protein